MLSLVSVVLTHLMFELALDCHIDVLRKSPLIAFLLLLPLVIAVFLSFADDYTN